MLNDLMGIINLSENDEKIKELTYNRPIAAIPFGGRFRVIDFAVSNMVNSGMDKVAIFTKDKFRSLQDHLGPGKYWGLDRKRDGLFMIHPMVDYSSSVRRYGDLENFVNNLGFIEHSRQEYVLITRSYMVTNIDYSKAFSAHKKSGADMTVICKKITNGFESTQFLGLDIVNMDEDKKVTGIGRNFGNREEYCLSLEMYIMKKELLVDIIVDAYQNGDSDYLKQAVFKRIPNMNVKAHHHDGEVCCINTMNNYYKFSMDLLNRKKFNNIFHANGSIYTKIKDEPPTLYTDTSSVSNSLIANGCKIEGTVENSILFRGVHVKKGSIIRNSIIMQDSIIGETASLNFVIADKNTIISDKKMLMGDGGIPFVIKKSQKV